MTLTANQIHKKYRRPTKNASHFEAVAPTDLTVTGGKITGITGRSGSGKSTLLYMMAGLLQPTDGTVILRADDNSEHDIYRLSDGELSRLRNMHTGIIPQGQTGLFALSVIDNVTVPAALYGNSADVTERAERLLERLGILGLKDARINELSGGELRRLAVARALVMSPKILFADEPTDDLDNENTALVLALLREYADEGGAVLLVTHEAGAEKITDELYRMDGGKLSRA